MITVKPFAKKYVLTNPETGAVVYSEQYQTWEAYQASLKPAYELIMARRAERQDKVCCILADQVKRAEQSVRKPIFDRSATRESHSFAFGAMVAAELQKAGIQ